MTSSRDQEREGKTSIGEPTTSVSPQRRRLLKGLAATAPGIFTLYSGSAQAMASGARCLSSAQANFDQNTAVVTDDPFSGKYNDYCPQVELSSDQPTILVKGGPNYVWLRQVPNGGGVWYAVQTTDTQYTVLGASTWAPDTDWEVVKGILDDPNDKLEFANPNGDTTKYKQFFY